MHDLNDYKGRDTDHEKSRANAIENWNDYWGRNITKIQNMTQEMTEPAFNEGVMEKRNPEQNTRDELTDF